MSKELRMKQKEIDDLKHCLSATDSQLAAPTSPQMSPEEQEAVDILINLSATPCSKKEDSLIPLVETVQKVRAAPIALKKCLFKPDDGNRRRGRNTQMIAKTLNMSQDYVYHDCKPRNKRLTENSAKRNVVNNYLRRQEHCITFPGKREKGCKYGLTETMDALYLAFKEEYPHLLVGRSFFYNARSPNIKLVVYTKRRMCVCLQHANFNLLLKASQKLLQSVSQLLNLSDAEIREVLSTLPESEEVKYQQWAKVDIAFKGRVIKRIDWKICQHPRKISHRTL